MTNECDPCSTPTPADNSVESKCLATIEQDQGSCVPSSSCLVQPSEESCMPHQISTTTDGSSQPWMTDARETTRLTLLGRVGKRLHKFVGSGFLQVEDGEAKLVSFIPLKIKELYHRYVIPSPGSVAVIGAAKPVDYLVVADNTGKTYGIKGLSGEDCFILWDYVTKKFLTRPITDFPIATKGALLKCSGIELVGFLPPSPTDASESRRVKALKGEGVVFMTNVPQSYPPCLSEDERCAYETSAVARVVPYPDDSSGKEYLLAWKFGVGPVYVEKPSSLDGAKGDKGDTGHQGVQGINGVKGDKGDAGSQGDTGPKGTTGASGEAGNIGDVIVSTAKVTVDISSLVTSNITSAQNVNPAVTTDLNFGAATTSESDWTHISNTSNFILGSGDYVFVEITANIVYANATSDNNTKHPVFDLYKNGSLIQSAGAYEGLITNDTNKNSILASGKIVFRDSGPIPAGTSYKIRCRAGNDNDAPVIGLDGYFQAKAVKRVQVVTNVTLTTPS